MSSVAQLLLGAATTFVCDAADFDGTNDYVSRGAALTSVASSKLFTFVVWLNSTVTGAEQRIFCSADPAGGTDSVLNIRKTFVNTLEVLGENASTTPILRVDSTGAIPAGWVCVMFSVDMADTGKRFMYFGDSSALSPPATYTNDTLDFVSPDWLVGARGDGALKFTGGIANLMFWPGIYTDFSVTANRRLFITAAGKAADLGLAINTLGSPAVCLYLGDGEAAANFARNEAYSATGGAFSVTGTLTTYGSSPSD